MRDSQKQLDYMVIKVKCTLCIEYIVFELISGSDLYLYHGWLHLSFNVNKTVK